ncbi:DNA-binding protein [Nostoc sp. CHAB 5834]|nr:DNA-binding protein [Nostoc sp. CHAB 5834]
MTTDDDQPDTNPPSFTDAPSEDERVEERHVHAACDALNAQGRKPTHDGIRELLGKGSYTTITMFRATWRPKSIDLAPPLPGKLAETGQSFAAEFWREAVLQANGQLLQERKAAKETLDEAQAAIRALEVQVEASEAKLAEARGKLEEAAGKLRASHHQHTDLRDKLVRCEGELKVLRPLMERLQLSAGASGAGAAATP